MKKFIELGLNKEILKEIEKLRITIPTKIQEDTIPLILEGKDIIGESATGSGKTLAFASGIIENSERGKGIQALVLTPTRELAEQVKKAIISFSKDKLKITSVYGGVSMNPQITDLTRADVVVATPGRLLDHLERRTINLSNVKILVLDEADRMFDMGFIDDVEKIIRACPKKRQTLCFSATISSNILRLANRHMKNPIKISSSKQVDPEKLKQFYYDVPKNLKLSLLINLIQKEEGSLSMIFCNTRKTTDFVVKNLRNNKIDAIAIHGGLTQNKRDKTISLFNKGKVFVLVCTDVAARGLHINNVSHIYNYEIPKDPTDYVHRIGRTARAGESGKVINLLTNMDHGSFSRIMSEFRKFSIKKIEIPELKKIIVKNEVSRQNFRERRNFGERNDFSRGRFQERNKGRNTNQSHGKNNFRKRNFEKGNTRYRKESGERKSFSASAN
jgi:ATP-dependent RNA helicase DeaD